MDMSQVETELDTFDVEGGVPPLDFQQGSGEADPHDIRLSSDEELDYAGGDEINRSLFDPRPSGRSEEGGTFSKALQIGGKFAKYLPTPDFLRDNEEYERSERTMAVMKEAIHNYSQDKYFESGEVTAKVELEDGESEDDAVIVSLNNVHKTYLLGVEGVPALRGVTLQVRRGEFLVIYGTSGGGKTSLLNIIGTIDKPTKGSLKICGTRVSKSTSDAEFSELRRNKLGFVFQTFNLLSALTAEENVELPMILAGRRGRGERQRRARELLAKVGMGKRLDHLPSQLSGGEQQRVTIARAVSNDPEVLLLDEPTGDLDSVNTLIVMKLLLDLNHDDGITLVMVTHDVALKSYADRVVWMRDGKIQRVETVPQHVRESSFDQLQEDFRDLHGRGLFDQSEGDAQPWGTRLVGGIPLIGPMLVHKLGWAEGDDAGAVWEGSQEESCTGAAEVVFSEERTEVRQPRDYHTHAHNVRDEGSSGTTMHDASSSEREEELLDWGKGKGACPDEASLTSTTPQLI